MSEDIYKDYQTIQAELAAFGHGLDTKPQVLAMSKMDLPDAQAAYELFCHATDAPQAFQDCIPISAATGQNVRGLLTRAVQVLDTLPPIPLVETEPVLQVDADEFGYEIKREGGGFRIISPKLVKRVETTRWDLDEAVQRFQHLLERSGITKELENRGIKPGDTVYIGDYELEWAE
jgi:GTP-binding protein